LSSTYGAATAAGSDLKTSYTYDQRGNVLTTTQSFADDTDRRVTTYEYDSLDRKTRIIDAEGYLTRVAYDIFGNQSFNVRGEYALRYGDVGYDAGKADRATWIYTEFSYDALDRMTSMSDSAGNTTRYGYDERGNRIWEEEPDIDGTNHMSRFKTYKYDGRNELIQSDTPGGVRVYYTYDKAGNKIQDVTLLQGAIRPVNVANLTGAYYDSASQSLNLQAWETVRIEQQAKYEGPIYANPNDPYDPLTTGTLSTVVHNLASSLMTTVSTSVSVAGYYTIPGDFLNEQGTQENAWGRVANRLYGDASMGAALADALGHPYLQAGVVLRNLPPVLRRTDLATGAQTVASLNPSYLTTSETRDVQRVVYLDTDKLAAAQSAESSGLTVGWSGRTYEYDGNHNLTAEIVGNVHRTEHSYDAMGNVTQHKYGAGSIDERSVKMTYDLNNRKTADIDGYGLATTYAYDKLGNRTKVTDAMGNVARYYYNAKGQMTMVVEPTRTMLDGTTVIAGQPTGNFVSGNAISAFKYDSAGNRTEERTYMKPYTGALSDTTAPTLTNGDGSKPASTDRVVILAYDGNNRLIRRTDADGVRTDTVYDGAGQKVKTLLAANASYFYVPQPQETDWQSVTWSLYGNNDPATVAALKTALNYLSTDPLPAVLVNPPTSLVVNGTSYPLASAKVQGGPRVQSYAYDTVGRLMTFTDVDGTVTSYEYDAAGNKKSMTVRNTVVDGLVSDNAENPARTTLYTYDANNRLASETQVDVSGFGYEELGPYSRKEYQYDAFGNVSRFTVFDSKTSAGKTGIGTKSDTGVEDRGTIVTREHSATNGKLIRTSAQVFNWNTYKYEDIAGIAPAYTTYDVVGNLTQTTEGGNTTYYVYDLNNRKIQEIKPQVDVYTVDGGSQRVSPSTLTTYDAVGREAEVAVGSVSQYGHTVLVTSGTPTVEKKTSLTVKATLDAGEGGNVDGNLTLSYRLSGAAGYTTVDMAKGTGGVYQLAPADVPTLAQGLYEIKVSYTDKQGREVLVERKWVDTTKAPASTTLEGNSFTADFKTTRYYDSANHLVAELNGDNAWTTYAYDAAGNLVRKSEYTNRLSASKHKPDLNAGEGNRLMAAIEADAPWINPNGTVKAPDGIRATNYEYDLAGRVTKVTLPKTEVTTPGALSSGNMPTTHSLSWTSVQLQGTANCDVSFSVSLSSGERNDMGAGGLRLVYRVAGSGAAWSNPLTLTYFANDKTYGTLPNALTLAGGVYDYKLFYQDADGDEIVVELNQLDTQQPSGYVNSATSKQVKNLTELHQYNVYGDEIKTTDRAGNVTYSYYDAKHNKTGMVDPLGYLVAWKYNKDGQQTKQFVFTGKVDLSTINTWVQPRAFTGSTGTTGSWDGYLTSRVYTVEGKLAIERLPDVNVATPSAASPQTEPAVDNITPITHFGYDVMGNQVSRRNTQGGVEQRIYDAAGRVVATLDGSRVLTVMEYDPVGNMTRATKYYGTVPIGKTFTSGPNFVLADLIAAVTSNADYDSGKNQVTECTYDAMHRMTSKTELMSLWTSEDDLTQRYKYDAQGNRTWSQDEDGYVTQTVFDARAHATRTVTPDGLTTRMEYDAAGNMTKAYAGNLATGGWRVDMSYNALNQKIGEVQKDGLYYEYGLDAGGSTVEVRKYGTKTDVNGQVMARHTSAYKIVDARGRVLHEYGPMDASGKRSHTHYDYDVLDRVTVKQVEITEGSGESVTSETTYTYNGTQGTPKSESDPQTGLLTRTYLNAFGQVTAKVTPMNELTQYFYDLTGNLVKEIDAEGKTTVYTYDLFNRKIAQTDGRGTTAPTGLVAGYTNNLQIYSSTPQGASTELALSITVTSQAQKTAIGSNGSTPKPLRLSYRRVGDSLAPTEVDMAWVSGANWQTKLSNLPAGAYELEIYYQDSALKQRVTLQSGVVSTTTVSSSAAGQSEVRGDYTTRYEYDQRDRLITVQQAQGWHLANDDAAIYAAERKRLGYAEEAATLVAAQKEELQRLYATRYAYDGRNNRTETVENLKAGGASVGAMAITKQTYDGMRRVVETARYGNDVSNYASTGSITATFSGTPPSQTGTLTGSIVLAKEVADTVNGSVTLVLQNLQDRSVVPITIALTAQKDVPSVGQTTYSVPASKTVPAGQYSLQFGFTNKDGKLVTGGIGLWTGGSNAPHAVFDNATPSTTVNVNVGWWVRDSASTVQYDSNGNLWKTIDEMDRVSSSTYGAFGRKATSTDQAGVVTTYTYDSYGNVIRETTPVYQESYSGSTQVNKLMKDIRRSYDGAGRLIRIEDYSDPNNPDNPTLQSSTDYTYTLDGLRKTEIFKTYDGVSTATTERDITYFYDDDRRMVRWAQKPSSPGAAAPAMNYAYDEDGNLREIYSDLGWDPEDKHAGDDTNYRFYYRRYTFDKNRRLKTESDVVGNRTLSEYFYDAAGNRTTWIDGSSVDTTYTWNYTTDANNRVAEATTTSFAANSSLGWKRTWEYDLRGNATKETTDELKWSHILSEKTTQYDKAGRVSHTDLNVKAIPKPNGDKIGGVDKNEVTDYTYDLSGRLLSTVQTGSNAARYDYEYFADGRESRVYVNGDNNAATLSFYNASRVHTRTTDSGGVEKKYFESDNEGHIVYSLETAKPDAHNLVRTTGLSYLYANGNLVGQIQNKDAHYPGGGNVDPQEKSTTVSIYSVQNNPAVAGNGSPLGNRDTRPNGLINNIGVQAPGDAYPGSNSSYSVHSGDTLQSIASQFYGNPSLWYVIADANGLSSDSVLSANMQLKIPSTTQMGRLTADNHLVYNETALVGSTLPPVPVPGPDLCTRITPIIMLALMAVLVSVVTAGLAAPVGAAIVGSAGLGASIVGGMVVSVGMTAVLAPFKQELMNEMTGKEGWSWSNFWTDIGTAAVSGIATGMAQGAVSAYNSGKMALDVAQQYRYGAAMLNIVNSTLSPMLQDQDRNGRPDGTFKLGNFLASSVSNMGAAAIDVGSMADAGHGAVNVTAAQRAGYGVQGSADALRSAGSTASVMNYVTPFGVAVSPWVGLAAEQAAKHGFDPGNWHVGDKDMADAIGGSAAGLIDAGSRIASANIREPQSDAGKYALSLATRTIDAGANVGANLLTGYLMLGNEKGERDQFISSAIGHEVGNYIGSFLWDAQRSAAPKYAPGVRIPSAAEAAKEAEMAAGMEAYRASRGPTGRGFGTHYEEGVGMVDAYGRPVMGPNYDGPLLHTQAPLSYDGPPVYTQASLDAMNSGMSSDLAALSALSDELDRSMGLPSRESLMGNPYNSPSNYGMSLTGDAWGGSAQWMANPFGGNGTSFGLPSLSIKSPLEWAIENQAVADKYAAQRAAAAAARAGEKAEQAAFLRRHLYIVNGASGSSGEARSMAASDYDWTAHFVNAVQNYQPVVELKPVDNGPTMEESWEWAKDGVASFGRGLYGLASRIKEHPVDSAGRLAHGAWTAAAGMGNFLYDVGQFSAYGITENTYWGKGWFTPVPRSAAFKESIANDGAAAPIATELAMYGGAFLSPGAMLAYSAASTAHSIATESPEAALEEIGAQWGLVGLMAGLKRAAPLGRALVEEAQVATMQARLFAFERGWYDKADAVRDGARRWAAGLAGDLTGELAGHSYNLALGTLMLAENVYALKKYPAVRFAADVAYVGWEVSAAAQKVLSSTLKGAMQNAVRAIEPVVAEALADMGPSGQRLAERVGKLRDRVLESANPVLDKTRTWVPGWDASETQTLVNHYPREEKTYYLEGLNVGTMKPIGPAGDAPGWRFRAGLIQLRLRYGDYNNYGLDVTKGGSLFDNGVAGVATLENVHLMAQYTSGAPSGARLLAPKTWFNYFEASAGQSLRVTGKIAGKMSLTDLLGASVETSADASALALKLVTTTNQIALKDIAAVRLLGRAELSLLHIGNKPAFNVTPHTLGPDASMLSAEATIPGFHFKGSISVKWGVEGAKVLKGIKEAMAKSAAKVAVSATPIDVGALNAGPRLFMNDMHGDFVHATSASGAPMLRGRDVMNGMPDPGVAGVSGWGGMGGGGGVRSPFIPAPHRLDWSIRTQMVDGYNTNISIFSDQTISKSGEVLPYNRFRPGFSSLTGTYGLNGDLYVELYRTTIKDQHVGREMLSRAIETFGPDNVEVVRASFGIDNKKIFNAGRDAGLTRDQAVWNTPFGRSMRDLGYIGLEPRTDWIPGNLRFYRPLLKTFY
jgi:YD repeat-containing protein